LEPADIAEVLRRALTDPERGFGGRKIEVEDGAVEFIAAVSDGDARTALNALELAVKAAPGGSVADGVIQLKRTEISQIIKRSHLLYDKTGEEHYSIISALHKSLRGSDPDGALYWLGRMLEAGEDPLYVARRLVRFASEDVGLADPQALVQAMTAFQATHALGLPECNVILAQAVVYLAQAPKSNALYLAYGRVQADIVEAPNEPVPLHLRNAPTKLMKELNYGKGYIYNPSAQHDAELREAAKRQEYLPDKLRGKKYWKPA
jgi:putative ATPase